MTDETVSDHVAAKVRDLRKARNWQTYDLAAECRKADPDTNLTENVLENIESGRRRDGKRTRDVTVDELAALARVLGCTTAFLLGEHSTPANSLGPIPFEDLDNVINALTVFRSALDAGIVGRGDE